MYFCIVILTLPFPLFHCYLNKKKISKRILDVDSSITFDSINISVSGKLQVLNSLLRDLFLYKHRCLIFTQMARVLDILQAFLSFHGYQYFRLDGTTGIEQRQVTYLLNVWYHQFYLCLLEHTAYIPESSIEVLICHSKSNIIW